ncbi:MAG: hypothetical protein ACLPX9_14975 [Rhodomicrobium sp.]
MADFGGFTAEIFSGVAVAVSGYNLWYTSLRKPILRAFVPPVMRYASPYQNSIFEVFEIPLTIVNEGALTGTVLSLNLQVTSPKGASKHFYSAGLGSWSIGKARGEGLNPFTPISLPGRTSHSEVILFYAREDSSVLQIVEDAGRYKFAMSSLTAHAQKKEAQPLEFEMKLPYMDHRAFTTGAGTLPLHHPQWQAVSNKV